MWGPDAPAFYETSLGGPFRLWEKKGSEWKLLRRFVSRPVSLNTPQ
jgi:hypothetical protein